MGGRTKPFILLSDFRPFQVENQSRIPPCFEWNWTSEAFKSLEKKTGRAFQKTLEAFPTNPDGFFFKKLPGFVFQTSEF